MTKISHIVPTDLLELIDGRDFYMCLANIALKNKTYRDFYKKQVERGAFVLMDNGAAEYEQPSLEEIWSVAKVINPTELILNDVVCDKDETIKRSLESIEFYRNKGYKGQFMFVPQGRDFTEWCKCYDVMKDNPEISTYGISKYITNEFGIDARVHGCRHIEMSCERDHFSRSVHLLGCHVNINEVKSISLMFEGSLLNVRSNDTAIAYIYAQANKLIDQGDRPCGEINFINSDLNEDQIYMLKRNMFIFDNYEGR